ncbi:abc transporter family protein [Stylonychia lemnae]|uniref:Abc transporter family protein n=1 Tax=Stylonychia lemnae TaxID=5949 RepID=A0A078B992_STYLE|nr:abc transporter family protein [Stylonychia lemnae]|eukprot:CDW90801.1 abc transporter family protein [Stylonychia lemnae]
MSMIEFSRFFRNLTKQDKILISIGTFSAVVTGILLPIFALLSGELANTFEPSNTPEKIKEAMNTVSLQIALLGFESLENFVESAVHFITTWRVVEESLVLIKLIVSFSKEDKEIRKFEKLAEQAKNHSDKSENWTSAFIGLLKFIIFGFYGFNSYLGTIFIQYNITNPSTGKDYTTGQIISVIVAFMNCTTMIFQISPSIQGIVKARVVGRQIYDIIDQAPKHKKFEQDTIQELTLNNGIKFESVTFQYQKASQVTLKDASFTIEGNKTTAIVGNSGSGKSTIIQLIERFYLKQNGKIYFDNLEIENIDLKTLRESIGYVQQEPILIMGTIRHNILLGNKDASQKDIDDAIAMANADFVYSLEHQIETYVGSSNIINLSGGQKQRIAIARALIKKPQILIIDEATSALDPKSEKDVQLALKNIQKSDNKLTIIIIAHRIQTIIAADNLIILDKDHKINQASKGTKIYEEVIEKLELKNQQFESSSIQSPSPFKQQILEKGPQEFEIQFHKLKTSRDLISNSLNDSKCILREESQEIIKPNQSQDILPKEYGGKHIMKFYKPYSKVFLTFIATCCNSFAFPLYGYIFSKVIFVMLGRASPTFVINRNIWCGAFIALAVGMGIFEYLNRILHSQLGENLALTIKKKLFSSMIRQNIEWYDQKERAPGILSGMLQADVSQLKGLTSQTYALILEALLCLIIGIALSFLNTWKMALVTVTMVPFIILGGMAEQIIVWNSVNSSTKSVKDSGEQLNHYDKANALLSDIIINYKTVVSLGEKNVNYLVQKYQDLLEEPKRMDIKHAHISGIIYGYSQCIRFLFIAFIFYLSSVFIFEYNDEPEDTYVGVYTLFVSAIGTGSLISQLPSRSKSKQAANKIFKIIESQQIDNNHDSSRQVANYKQKEFVKQGEIEFKNLSFKYPSRDKKVLNNFSLKIPIGFKVALVGHSSSGKSTIANLLLRLYDYEEGSILIDGQNIKEYDVNSLRNSIGYVMQEPLLFNVSIKENITYGIDEASDEKVREVAEMANALQFIENFSENQDQNFMFASFSSQHELVQPSFDNGNRQQDQKMIKKELSQGFNKKCGLKGSLLSGGQKQRIAIARALIKDPKILILDEATSALDEQSQELVNIAIEKAMIGRTSIVIAHRLSTIRNCDLICVLHNGKMVEQGTFQGLSDDEDSYFYKLKSGMEM